MRRVALASLLIVLLGCGGAEASDPDSPPADEPSADEPSATEQPDEQPEEEPAPTAGDEGDACAVDDQCQAIQCFRAVTCVAECGDEPIGCGCCPCAEGFEDAITCAADR